MKLPGLIKIGSQFWTVVEQKRKHSADQDHYGFTYGKDLSIVLDSEMPDSLKRVTLFHELLHAIRFTYGSSMTLPRNLPYTDVEHYWIGLYEEPVVAMLRENPDLVAYLLSNDA